MNKKIVTEEEARKLFEKLAKKYDSLFESEKKKLKKLIKYKKLLKIELKVMELDQINKSQVGIEEKYKEWLELKWGNVIEIKGKNEAIGIIVQTYPSYIGEKLISMDKLFMNLLGVKEGDFVTINKY